MRLQVAVAMAAAMCLLPLAEAAAKSTRGKDGYRARAEARYLAKLRRSQENSYTARANDLDPAREYGGYPDWARVALSPKLDNGRR